MFEVMPGVLKSMDTEMQQEHKLNEEKDLVSHSQYVQ